MSRLEPSRRIDLDVSRHASAGEIHSAFERDAFAIVDYRRILSTIVLVGVSAVRDRTLTKELLNYAAVRCRPEDRV